MPALKSNSHSTRDQTVIHISREPIRLGQFLKLANTVQDGLEAKIRIANGDVQVNGRKETQRGKKLVNGDVVEIDDILLQVVTTEK